MPRLSRPLKVVSLLAAVPGAAPAQLFVEQRVVVKVQRVGPPALLRPRRWVEKKGPKCLPLGELAGASIQQPDAVDIVTEGGARYRARLDDDCPSLDFYSGFYFKPTRDGRICADRDALRSRSGRSCGIDAFRRLVPKR